MGAGRYWERMEEMKAHVEPLPFVPAMWMTLSLVRSEGAWPMRRRHSTTWVRSWESCCFVEVRADWRVLKLVWRVLRAVTASWVWGGGVC